MTRKTRLQSKAGNPPQALEDHDLEPAHGGIAMLRTTEPVRKKTGP